MEVAEQASALAPIAPKPLTGVARNANVRFEPNGLDGSLTQPTEDT